MRAAHVLENETDHTSLFLKLFSKYLSIESKQSYLDEPEIIGCPRTTHDLKALAVSLENIKDKDAFLLYLMGVIYIKLKRTEDGKDALIRSVASYPFNWSAWLELGSLSDKAETVIAC